MSAAVKLTSVTKLYGNVAAVDNLNLEANEGEILGLIGPNGAGKTTTLKMIVGLLKATSGTVEVIGRDVSDGNKEVKKYIGYLPEEDALYDIMTVRQYLRFFSEIYGLSKREAGDRIDSLLASLKLAGKNKLTGELSKGMKRKVAIARTLLHDPSLLVLDEPGAGLDPLTSIFINGYLKELSRRGKTIIFSGHNLFQIESVCDRVAIIKKGELLICDTVAAIREKLGKREYEVVFRAGAGLNYERRDGNYVFHAADIEQVSSLLEKVTAQNWTLVDISVRQTALEELYAGIVEDNTP